MQGSYEWEKTETMLYDTGKKADTVSKPFFSIIIPVYNEGERLLRTLHSVQNQTDTDIEILLIDDGSTYPETLRILEMGAENPQTRLIHKENGGVSSARNVGIKEAMGEYLIFLDGDDYLEPDACEQYRSKIITYSHKPDLLITNYIIDNESRGEKQKVCVISREQLFENNKELAVRSIYTGSMFNNRGCYHRKHILETHTLYNEDWVVFEDIDFVLRLMLAARTIAVTTYAAYHYCLFRKHRELSLKRFKSQVSASAYWINKLQTDPYEEETRMQLCKMLADQLCVYFLMTGNIPAVDRSDAYAICSEVKTFLRYGSDRSNRILRWIKQFGVKQVLMPLGIIYRFTHRKVVC